ncbi:unnamed protein product [Strongylus vulgaris]|uniref:Uncharacterized protein n=1 Tax=Strongylus vulgaris TaxID=40348 RepID=A0A3P7IIL5_STRVU|nr:unnamed protein product [Strongylus vulgaris]
MTGLRIRCGCVAVSLSLWHIHTQTYIDLPQNRWQRGGAALMATYILTHVYTYIHKRGGEDEHELIIMQPQQEEERPAGPALLRGPRLKHLRRAILRDWRCGSGAVLFRNWAKDAREVRTGTT